MHSRRPRRCSAVGTYSGRNASSSRLPIRFARLKRRPMWSKRARSSRPVSWPRSGSTGARLILTTPAPRGCSQTTDMEAETFHRRAIVIDEKVLGKDHPDVARDYNNLALLLHAQGKYDQAEPLYRRAIENDEKILGKDHPNVALRYNNLALLLQDRGKFDQAEPLYRRAIQVN